MWCCFYNIIPPLFTRNGDSYAEARQYYSVSDGDEANSVSSSFLFAFLMRCIFNELMVIQMLI